MLRRNKKKPLRDYSTTQFSYWIRHNKVCIGVDCKHKGKTPQELTELKVRHGSGSHCITCYQRIKYPPGRRVFAGISYG